MALGHALLAQDARGMTTCKCYVVEYTCLKDSEDLLRLKSFLKSAVLDLPLLESLGGLTVKIEGLRLVVSLPVPCT